MDTRQHHNQEFDVTTVDYGRTSGSIVTSVLRNGELVITRKTSYLPAAPDEFVRNMMMLHHHEVVGDLDAGVLDGEINDSLQGLPSIQAQATPVEAARPQRIHESPQQLHSSDALVTYEAAGASGRVRFTVTMKDAKTFLDLYYTRGSQHGMMVESQDTAPLGQAVDIILATAVHRFETTAQVTWRRVKGSDQLRPGVGVEFSRESVPGVERLVELALGIQDSATQRRYPRYRCSLEGRLAVGRRSHSVLIGNVGLGGALVLLANPPTPPTPVTLMLQTGAFLPWLRVPADVAWSRVEPSCAGLRFVEEAAGWGRLQRLVTRLGKSG